MIWWKGLSVRASNSLFNGLNKDRYTLYGVPRYAPFSHVMIDFSALNSDTAKLVIRKLLENGDIYLKRIRGISKITENEIMNWCGLGDLKEYNKPISKHIKEKQKFKDLCKEAVNFLEISITNMQEHGCISIADARALVRKLERATK